MRKFFTHFFESFFSPFKKFRQDNTDTAEFSFPTGTGFQVKQIDFDEANFDQANEVDDNSFSLFQSPSKGHFFE